MSMAKIIELTSPNGWPASEDRRALGIETFTVPGTKIRFACAKAVAPILVSFAKDFHELVEPIDQGQIDDWGYAFRQTRGSDRVLSNHASGTAIDLNAIKHPLGKSNTFNKHQRNTINLLITKYGLTWGGNYKRRKDDMHFEIALDQNEVKQKIKELGLK
jgi:replication initiation and membrane attachment protein DnaB